MFNSGHTAPRVDEAIKKQLIAKRTSQSFILADPSKFVVSSNVHALELEDAIQCPNDNDSQIAKETKIICP